jgi:glycosyltransferase involved in cell wall biosynthesis
MAVRPLVSVVMCFFNEEKFIQDAIESVINQTYDSWELLLVDDGSTDNSTYIAKAFATRNSARAYYLEHEGRQNKGLSTSRNLGIKHAKGEYISFLDCDDIYLPRNLEQQVEIMTSNPDAAAVYGPGEYWYSWTGNPDDSHRDFISKLGIKPGFLYKPLALLPRFLQDENISPLTCCLLVGRELMERIGGFEETFPGLYEDQVIFAKICIESPIFVHNKCLAKYRRHPDSLCAVAAKTTANKNGQYHSSRLQFLSWLESYLLIKGIRDAKVWWVLKNELLPYRHPALYRLIRVTPKSATSYVLNIIAKIVPDEAKNTVKRLIKYKTSQGVE